MKKARPVVECLRKVRLLSLSKHETTCKTISTFLLLSLFLISCKSTGVTKSSEKITVDGLRPIYITNTKKVNLLPPAAAGGVFEGLQLLNGSFGDNTFSLMSYSQIDATAISLSLMNDFGADMGNLFGCKMQLFIKVSLKQEILYLNMLVKEKQLLQQCRTTR